MTISFFGIRHHGPGCARCLISALDEFHPDAILVEGPPDAQEMLSFMKSDNMVPPVALLIYPLDCPQQAVYYPFTIFSPEWQALCYALKSGVPARFIDMPQALRMAQEIEKAKAESAEAKAESAEAKAKSTQAKSESAGQNPESESLKQAQSKNKDAHDARGDSQVNAKSGCDADSESETEENTESCGEKQDLTQDPFTLVAQAAGYQDSELWWEHQIEQRKDRRMLFEAIANMMTALRTEAGNARINPEDVQREAYMRESIRKAEKEGFKNIAVICGAWHVPALANREDEKSDQKILKELKSVKVQATWIPWTNSRLSFRSGYGAGIYSPGWYEHLWTEPEKAPIRWIIRAAQLLRKQDLDASSASVIEAVRLAEALAALRDLPMPGLKELSQSIQTVLCFGNDSPMRLIQEKLEIGENMGQVPPETPVVPIQRDIESQQRALNLKPTTEIKDLDLDLREDRDRKRSLLLHRLKILDVEWGKPMEARGKRGSFHELWRIQWDVTFTVKLIEANIWGNTVEAAATGYACYKASETKDISVLTDLLDKTILADLPNATEHLLVRIQAESALSSDVASMMGSLPPMVRVAKYGDVRGTKSEEVLKVFYGLFERIVIGLPGACFSLDDEAARNIVEKIELVQQSLKMLNEEALTTEWHKLLQKLLNTDSIHGLVRGYCCRILLEERLLQEDELERLARINLSPVNPRLQSAFWIEGVLRGSGILLIHQDGLWRVMDRWISSLGKDDFVELLPLLRRAFSNFSAPERRSMGEKIKHLGESPQEQAQAADASISIDVDRANQVVPILRTILGAK